MSDERLAACLTSADPIELLDRIHDATETFRVGDRSDDLTAIAVRRAPTDITDEHDASPTNGASKPPNDDRNGTITP